MRSPDLNKKGFTIIELLIATVVFSLILLVVTGAIIQFSRLYYKGVIQSRTQEVARTITQDIAQNIQFGGSTPSSSPNVICIGSKRYTKVLNVQVGTGSNNHGLVYDSPSGGCSTASGYDVTQAGLASGAKEFLGQNMQLVALNVSEQPAGSGLWRVDAHVVYGADADLTDATKTSCKSIISGGQFCAVSRLTTAVSQRLD
jgi:prepilin-type N-terminal cleavage/methylation domain-containing protein